MSSKQFYKTKDAQVASMLYAQRQHLHDVERVGNVRHFVFDDATACEGLVRLYWAQELVGNIKEFADAERTIKNLIFAE